MRNVEFNNDEIKEYYKSLIRNQQGLSSVMLSLLQNNNLIIQDILNDDYIIQIIVNSDDDLINVNIDLLKNKIYVISTKNEYKEIYDNFPKKHVAPIGYEYSNGNKKLIKQNTFNLDNRPKAHYYDISEDGVNYNVLVVDDKNSFNEQEFIKKILYNNTSYKSIRELLVTILNMPDLGKYTFKMTDTKGGIAIIDHGNLVSYMEFKEKNKEYQKIYLENNEFYVERKVKEVYEDDMTTYIKKLGECNGKEKR